MYIIEDENGMFFAGFMPANRTKERTAPEAQWSNQRAQLLKKTEYVQTGKDLQVLGHTGKLFLHEVILIGEIK